MNRDTTLRCFLLKFMLVHIAAACTTALGETNLRTVESSFVSLQDSIRNKDLTRLQQIMVDPPLLISPRKDEWAKEVLALAQQESQMKDADVEFGVGVLHISEGTIVKIGNIDTGKAGGVWSGVVSKVVWLETRDGKIRGITSFVRQGDEWRWNAVLAGDGIWPAYQYDLSTPKRAYLTMAEAARRRDGLDDLLGVYSGIASTLKMGFSSGEYEITVARRKEQPKYSHVTWLNDKARLEEEMLPLEDSKQKCRVWRLDEQGKRTTFELFVKEGEEWKWLPDPKCIWYPANTDDDLKTESGTSH